MREFQELSKSPGWERLVEYAEKQMEHRDVGLHAQAEGLDSCIRDEFVKGEIAGIRLFLKIPEAVVRDYTEQLTELKEVLDNG